MTDPSANFRRYALLAVAALALLLVTLRGSPGEMWLVAGPLGARRLPGGRR